MRTSDRSYRLNAERRVLARYLPQYQFKSFLGTAYVEGWQETTPGCMYCMRLELPAWYPDEMPDLQVVSPKPLGRWDDLGRWVTSWGHAHSTHTHGMTPDGYVRICHELEWHPAKTCLTVFRKGIILACRIRKTSKHRAIDGRLYFRLVPTPNLRRCFMTEEEAVRRILEDQDQGDQVGKVFLFDPDTRTLRLKNVDECPPGAMVFDGEDLTLGCPETPDVVITLSGDLVEQKRRTGTVHDLGLLCWDDGGAYTCLHGDGYSGAVPGTLLFADEWVSFCIEGIGKPGDQVRIVVNDKGPEPAVSGGHKVNGRIDAVGYVRRDNVWRKAILAITPVGRQLFSRSRGLLETDVLAQAGLRRRPGFRRIDSRNRSGQVWREPGFYGPRPP